MDTAVDGSTVTDVLGETPDVVGVYPLMVAVVTVKNDVQPVELNVITEPFDNAVVRYTYHK